MTLTENPEPVVLPTQPTYGISMSTEAIEDLVRTGWAGSSLESVTPLPAGQSFNNKIYFLKIQHPDDKVQKAVLKVNGRFFDADKVHNEIGCLRLLELYCPEIPVPRVLAWSEDGRNATFISSDTAETKPLGPSHAKDSDNSNSGWILISRVPGTPVEPAELDAASGTDLATQLADIVTSWRHGLPSQNHCGSLRVQHSDEDSGGMKLDRPCGPGMSGLAVRGIVGEGIKLAEPITRIQDYYAIKLDDKLRQLESSNTYAQNKHLLSTLQKFRSESLPKLSFDDMFKQTNTASDTFVFTHYDLSPRNVLVSGRPLKITGIVDFEFAGYFSPIEEFLNDYVGNDGDWPKPIYHAYLEALEERGVATPAKSVKPDTWKPALWLESLLENVAPWWLSENTEAGKLEAQLKEAESSVREMLEKIESHIHG